MLKLNNINEVGVTDPIVKKPLHCKKILNYFKLQKKDFVYVLFSLTIVPVVGKMVVPCRGENCSDSFSIKLN